MHEFQLEYTVVECDECGSEKPALGQCPSCDGGSAVPDPHVEARTNAVEHVRRAAQIERHPLDAWELGEVWGYMGLWLELFLESLAKIAADPTNRAQAQEVGVVIASLATLTIDLSTIKRLRPATAFRRFVDQISEAFLNVADSYLEALVASTPEEATTHADAAQSAIDRAAELSNRAELLLDRLGVVEEAGPLPNRLAALASEAFLEIEAQSLTDLESAGARLFERIAAGRPCPVGLGSGLYLTWAHVESTLDLERFESVTKQAFAVLTAETAPLRGLWANDDWQAAFASASQEMFDAALEIDAAIEGSGGIERLEVRAAIRLGALLVERVAQTMLATFLCIRGRRDWRSMRNRDVNSLLKESRDAGFETLLVGIDIALRDADAHGQFRLVEDVVEFTSDRREYHSLTTDELVDRLLAAGESLLALHTAVTCAMAVTGVPVEDIDTTMSLMTPQQQLTLALGINGLRDVQIAEQDGTFVLEATASYPVRKPVSIAASIHPYLPHDAAELTLNIQDPEITIAVEGPIEVLNAWQEASGEFEKEARFVEVLRRFKVNGRPISSKEHIRKWAAVRAAEVITAPLQEATARLEELAVLGRRLGDAKLERSMASIERLVQARAQGRPGRSRDGYATDIIVRWMNQDLSAPSQDPRE